MTLRFCALASGSRGNALLVEHDDSLIMIDCGLPLNNFGSAAKTLDLVLQNSGRGELELLTLNSSENWMEITAAAIETQDG